MGVVRGNAAAEFGVELCLDWLRLKVRGKVGTVESGVESTLRIVIVFIKGEKTRLEIRVFLS